MKPTLVYALLLIPSLIISCSVTKNRNSNESTQNSELQKESEKTSLQKDSEVNESYQHDKDTSSTHISFGFDTLSFPIYPIENGGIELQKGNWVKINPDGTIEVRGDIKDVWHNSKKETTKKDSTNRQSLDSNHQKENLNYIIKTITVTKTLMVEKKPDYWGIIKWAGGVLAFGALVYFLLWAYKKWMQRFTIIP